MSFLRRTSFWIRVLVIAAMMASPIARAHCYALLNAAETLAKAIEKPCHEDDHGMMAANGTGNTGEQPAQHHHENHRKSTDCPVCLALAHSVSSDAAVAAAGPSDPFQPAEPAVDHRDVPASKLHLGGLGSRAPPLKA